MDKLDSKYRYVILPARPSKTFSHQPLYNQAYTFWKDYWQRTFRRKAPHFWNALDFIRQDLIFCLMRNDEIVAQNIGMFANVDDIVTFDLPYFESFQGDAINLVRARDAKTAMTLEYTSVNPTFGERRTGFRFAEIINGLGLETFKARNIDVTFGTPRRLTGLCEVTANYGYKKISEGLQKAGWNLDVYLGFKGEIKLHPDPLYKEMIQHLWDNRLDYSTESPSRLRAGAFTQTKVNQMTLNIREHYKTAMADVCNKFDSLDWENRNVYGLFLTQAYGLVRHTTRLLSVCAGYCPFEYEDTHNRLIQHRQEESGHDKIALADLMALGVDLNQTPELDETRQLIQMQYDKMRDVSALSFFGYILLLEGLAVMKGDELQKRCAKTFGPRTTRFLALHADDDIEHIEKALSQIESFDADDQMAAMDNLRQSAAIYKLMLEHVTELAPKLSIQPKASAMQSHAKAVEFAE